MEPLYTLPEIAQLTGISLAELELYESEFPDLLPPPQWGPLTPPASDSAAQGGGIPAQPRLGWRVWQTWQRCRRTYCRWRSILRRWRPWTAVCQAFSWLRTEWKRFDPA